MKCRVYDRLTGTYFKSEVYAKINTGWYEKQLVIVPSTDGAYVKFIDYFDKSEKEPVPNVLINVIVPNIPADWIRKRTDSVDKQLSGFEGILNKGIRFFEYIGYPWIFENKHTLAELLNGGTIPFKGSIFENRLYNSEIAGWNYVENQEDADFLMKHTSSFHDSVLKGLNYTSGAYVDSNRSMNPCEDIRQVIMYIDSQWCDPIELIFEGVTALNLRPAKDNYTGDIFSASLHVENCSIFFCDDYLKKTDISYEGTWITAYSLRWRFIR